MALAFTIPGLWYQSEADLRDDVTDRAKQLGWPAGVVIERGAEPLCAGGEAAWRAVVNAADVEKLTAIHFALLPPSMMIPAGLDPGPPSLWWENAEAESPADWHHYTPSEIAMEARQAAKRGAKRKAQRQARKRNRR
jgi:hypothetical protein